MRFLFHLAWKNLSRYRKRTLITASALAFGLGIYLFMDSWLLGAELESERNLIWYETGSARILNEHYWRQRARLPLKHVIEDPQAVAARLAQMGIPTAARIAFGGELVLRQDPFAEDGSLSVRILAIDPRQDGAVFRLKESLEAGRYLEPGEAGIMLGSWLAKDLGARVGYPLTIVTRTRDGSYQTIDVEIVGILNCPNPAINKRGVFLPLDTADFYLEMRGAVTEIDLKLAEGAGVTQTAAALEQKLKTDFPSLEVIGWPVLARDYLALAGMKKGGSSIILFLVFIIAAVGISNTMLMAIYERIRELGMMRALGMKDGQIRLTFLFEAGGIGFLGSVLGSVLGFILCSWIVIWGVDLTSMIGEADIGYRISGISRGAWHPEAFIKALFFGVFLAVGVAFFSTRRALKKSITDCLRYH